MANVGNIPSVYRIQEFHGWAIGFLGFALERGIVSEPEAQTLISSLIEQAFSTMPYDGKLVERWLEIYTQVMRTDGGAQFRFSGRRFADNPSVFTTPQAIPAEARILTLPTLSTGDPDDAGPHTVDQRLFELYPNIPREVIRIEDHASYVRDIVSSQIIRNYLLDLTADAALMAEDDPLLAVANRRRLHQMHFILDTIETISLFEKESSPPKGIEIYNGFWESVLRTIDYVMSVANEDERNILAEIKEALAAEKNFGRYNRRMRETLLEGWVVVETVKQRLVRKIAGMAGNSRDVPLPTKLHPHYPLLEELADFARKEIPTRAPHEIMFDLSSLNVPRATIDRALLIAAVRNRLGDTNSFYEGLARFLFRPIDLNEPFPPFWGEYGGTIPIHDGLPALIEQSRRLKVPLKVEFGNFGIPYSASLSNGLPTVFRAGIDQREKRVVLDQEKPGERLIPLQGTSSQAAFFAATGPYANAVHLLGPPAGKFAQMLLSAILLVTPGGSIIIYDTSEDDTPKSLTSILDTFGLPMEVEPHVFFEGATRRQLFARRIYAVGEWMDEVRAKANAEPDPAVLQRMIETRDGEDNPQDSEGVQLGIIRGGLVETIPGK